MSNSTLEALGWDDWFAGRAAADCHSAGPFARVAAVDRELLLLINDSGVFRAKLSGKFMYDSRSSSELPCVGDWVCVEKTPADPVGLVHCVVGRKTSLRRKAAGESSRRVTREHAGASRRVGVACAFYTPTRATA